MKCFHLGDSLESEALNNSVLEILVSNSRFHCKRREFATKQSRVIFGTPEGLRFNKVTKTLILNTTYRHFTKSL